MKCPKCHFELNAASELAKQRALKLTPERRKEIALKAIQARWAKVKVA